MPQIALISDIYGQEFQFQEFGPTADGSFPTLNED